MMREFLNNTLGRIIKNVDWLHTTPATYVRYILAILAAVNTLLNVFHCNPINVNESELYDVVSSILFIAILLINTYYDNPISPEAIESNKYFQMLLEDKKNNTNTVVGPTHKEPEPDIEVDSKNRESPDSTSEDKQNN